jgi:hypothetical protein
MYILVRFSDNIIIGSAVKPIDEISASKNGYLVYEIADEEFNVAMIGSKLESFEEE